MKNKFIIFTILVVLAAMLVACAEKNKEEDIVADTDCYVSTVADLVGGTNGQFKELFNGECTAQISGMGGAMLTDRATGISVLYQPYDKNPWNTDISADGVYSENPFAEDMKIWRITLSADYDGVAVTDQSVLRNVFQTDRTIDSKVINKLLGQTPPLEKYKNDLYVSEQQIKVVHDIYQAEYDAMGMKFQITYFDMDGQMVAQCVLMEKGEINSPS